METDKFDRIKLDKIMNNYNEFYKIVDKYKDCDDYCKLFVPNISDYYKCIKMMNDGNKDYLKDIKEYENDNDDYLRTLKGKYKKIQKKQQRQILENSMKKNNLSM